MINDLHFENIEEDTPRRHQYYECNITIFQIWKTSTRKDGVTGYISYFMSVPKRKSLETCPHKDIWLTKFSTKLC